uniref:ORF12 n=1 Tax=Ascaris lumbricoides TaxID=6252 RepID=A0A0M3HV25_ASCLU
MTSSLNKYEHEHRAQSYAILCNNLRSLWPDYKNSRCAAVRYNVTVCFGCRFNRMVHVKFVLKHDDLYDPFTLYITSYENAYSILLDKLVERGFPANGKILTYVPASEDADWSRFIIDDNFSLWDAVEGSEAFNSGRPTVLEYYTPSTHEKCSLNRRQGLVYFRFKENHLCRRFLMKLDRQGNALDMLLAKLHQLGYKANGRLLVFIERDGSRTIIDDCISLWATIEMNCGYCPEMCLDLQYYPYEYSNTGLQESSAIMTPRGRVLPISGGVRRMRTFEGERKFIPPKCQNVFENVKLSDLI